MDVHYNKIFTFINFEKCVPPYINLCIKTWKQHLQNDYQIIILTPENLHQYIDNRFLTDFLTNPAPPYSPALYDYISFLVVYCNGGIFLDADTIVTDGFKPDFSLLNNYDTIFFSCNNKIIPGFIMSKKYSKLIEEFILKHGFEHCLRFKARSANINALIKNSLYKNFLLIDNKLCAYKLESLLCESFTGNKYKEYYFSTKYSIENFLKNNKGIVALQNSKTPVKYKKMSEAEFLKQDILLSKIFRVLL